MNIIFSFLTNIAVGIMVTWVFEFILKTNKKLRDRYYRRHEVLFGYHVHHSTIGLVVMVVGLGLLMFTTNSLAIGAVGFGIGIIIMHTISSKRLVFIERENFS